VGSVTCSPPTSIFPEPGSPIRFRPEISLEPNARINPRIPPFSALAPEPEILLLDEPTSGLDQDTTRQVEAVLRARVDDGVALLFATHDEALAERLGDRALRVREGKVTEAA